MGLLAGDLMTRKVFTLTPTMRLVEMDTVLVKHGVSGAPVAERGRLVGVASQADVLRAIWEGRRVNIDHGGFYASLFPIPIAASDLVERDGPDLGRTLLERTVADVMTRDPLVAHPEDPIEQVAERMVRDQIHRLPIVESDGSDELVGLITTLDLARAISLHGLANAF